jgi:hypothetical protein
MPMSVEKALATGVSRAARACAAFRAPASLSSMVDRDRGGIADRARARVSARMVSSMRRTSGCATIGARRGRRAPGGAALLALARIGERACCVARSAMATPCSPTASRALFIMVNMQAMPAVLLADEIADRAAAVAVDHGAGGRGVDAQLVLDRMRSARRCAPSEPSALTMNFGTRNSEMPRCRAAHRAAAPARNGRCCRSASCSP